MLARGTLEQMADAIEHAAGESQYRMSVFMTAKALALTLQDRNGTALCPTGPWGGLTMMADLVASAEIGESELPALVDSIWAARRIPPGESPRGSSPEAAEFLEKLESIQARVTGFEDGPR